RAGAFATIFFVALFYFPTRSGMETTVYLFFAVLVLRRVSAGHPWEKGAAGAAGTGLLLGLLMLTRLDVVFLAGLLVLALLAGGLSRRDLPRSRVLSGFVVTSVIATALLLPYLLYNFATTHHVMPISGAVKSAFPTPGWHWSTFSMAMQDRVIF